LLNKFLQLRNQLSNLVIIPDEDIQKLANLISDGQNELYNTLRYIKTVESGKLQGISFLYSDEETSSISKLFELIEDKMISLEDDELKRKKQEKFVRVQLEKLNSLREELGNNEIIFTKVEELISLLKEDGISDEDINKVLINLITDNYNVFTSSKIEKDQNDIVDIRAYLKENNISLNNVSQKELDAILSNSDVPYILEFLKNENLTTVLNNQPVLINILAYSSKKVIEDVLNKFKRLNISIRELNKIPIVLIDKEEDEEKIRRTKRTNKFVSRDTATKMAKGEYVPGAYNRFTKNISLLEQYQIPIDIENIPFALVSVGSKNFERNIKSALRYKLLTQNEHNEMIFLRRYNFEEIVDRYIEQGALYYIFKNKSRIVTYDKNLFYRMHFARKNGVAIYKENALSRYPELTCNPQHFPNSVCLIGEMNNSNGLGINSDNAGTIVGQVQPNIDYDYFSNMIKDVEPNYSTDNDVVKYLDVKYMENEFVYNIEGVLISRLKFIRNINALNSEINYDTLMYALTLNTILDETELSKIESLIEEILPRKRVL